VRPSNTTAYEGYSTMLHCVAVGDPTPVVRWDKNNRVSSFDPERFKVGRCSQSVSQSVVGRFGAFLVRR